ncbi:MAG: DUF2334 domain-containing protein [Terriglobia bacterium]|jgi:uncharacterized protein YdaL
MDHMLVRLLAFLKYFRLRRSSVAVLVFLTMLAISPMVGLLCAATPDDAADSSPAAVIYDSPPDPRVESYIHALFLANLLTHFNLHAELIPLSEYKRGQLSDYRAGFLVASGLTTTVPPSLLADIRATDRPFAWLGGHIDQLLATPDARRHYGFSFVAYARDLDYRSVLYKQTLLPKPETDLNIVSIQDPDTAEVVATAINQRRVSSPYVVKSGDFWYFADKPLSYMGEGTRYLVLCDLLHDILGINHPSEMRAMVRIEDVSIDDDPDDLTRIAGWLSDRHIPFGIALIPIFRDPTHSLEIRLGDRKATVKAIHTMIALGGTPIMHGITHQVHGLSGDEYEFWDELGNRQVGGDSADFVIRRLRMGFAECFANDIYPVAFEVPHYGASEIDYRTLGQTFSLFYDRPMVAQDDTTAQMVPYPVVDQYGRHIVPETLGYLPEDDPDPLKLVQYARSMRVVRDGIASFYFHPFLKQRLLEQVVQGISDLGYHFTSLREFDGRVDFQGQYAVRTTSGPIQLSPKDEYWRLQLFNATGQVVKTDLSATRLNGPVELAAEVPPGGWAAAEVMKRPPAAPEQANSWYKRISQWWDSLHPVTPPPSTIIRDKFAGFPSAWILWLDNPHAPASHNQQSYKTVLEALGYQVRTVPVAKFRAAPSSDDTLFVVPHAAGLRLTDAQQRLVVRYLGSGGDVVADGMQPWLTKIGFGFSNLQMIVSSVIDPDHTDVPLTWRPQERITRFAAPEGVRELANDSEGGQPVALAGSFGAGHYVYLAVNLDSYTNEGTSHYPYFPEYLSTTFGATTSLRNRHIEVYFDPDYRPGADFNRLATIWHRAGISTIHIKATVFTRQSSFPYDEFVRACHRNGIAVYAYFLFPMVTPKMWDDHPEWREKTAAGTDGNVGWRFPMNLQDPDCFQAAMDWAKVLLNSSDWDGVDIAELNFDAAFKDYLRPEMFVPMNDIVRADFKKKAGFDPIQLFHPNSPHYYHTDPAGMAKFQRYREDIVLDWHRRVLTELEPLCKQRGMEVIVTMLDSLHDHDEYVRLALGVDSRRITALMREFPFTLEVEDNSRFWMTSAERYRRFAATYLKLVPDRSRLMFDVNVVDDRDITGTNLPSKKATGTELALTLLSAASASGRVAVYSEYTVSPQDWDLIQMVLSRPKSVSGGRTSMDVNSSISLVLTPADDPFYYVDGHEWPAVSQDGVVMPTGEHSISTERSWWHFLDTEAFQARILSTTADLAEAHADTTGLTFRYRSAGRAVFVFDQQPNEVLVDGSASTLPTERNGRDWAVVFPAGDHYVRVATNTKAGVAVDVVGWASSWAIGAFGVLATVLMVVIYLQLRLTRLIKRNG